MNLIAFIGGGSSFHSIFINIILCSKLVTKIFVKSIDCIVYQIFLMSSKVIKRSSLESVIYVYHQIIRVKVQVLTEKLTAT